MNALSRDRSKIKCFFTPRCVHRATQAVQHMICKYYSCIYCCQMKRSLQKSSHLDASHIAGYDQNYYIYEGRKITRFQLSFQDHMVTWQWHLLHWFGKTRNVSLLGIKQAHPNGLSIAAYDLILCQVLYPKHCDAENLKHLYKLSRCLHSAINVLLSLWPINARTLILFAQHI